MSGAAPKLELELQSYYFNKIIKSDFVVKLCFVFVTNNGRVALFLI